jgi:hypothetical protein
MERIFHGAFSKSNSTHLAPLIPNPNDRRIDSAEEALAMKRTQLFTFGAIFMCFMVNHSATANAQAYVNQLSQGKGEAYVTQTPPTARPVPTTPRTATVAPRSQRRVKTVGYRPFPSVGKGSSVIISIASETPDWPTVGRGAVNR